MSVWNDLRKKSLGEELRKEDMVKFWEYGKCNPYKGVLDSKTEKILNEIYSFNGFAPFLPSDILEEKGDVKVYLDEECTREETVTLEQLEEELRLLEEEVRSLKELIEKLKDNAAPREIEELLNRKQKLEGRIQKIKEIISSLRSAGLDSYTIDIHLLGYYTREKKDSPCNKDVVPAIHLMMGTIEKEYPSDVPAMTGIVFVHELMHAFFDKHNLHPHCSEIEEPIAEYGMLCFMEMFERANPRGILDLAKDHVGNKQHSLGVFHYGYGLYLFEDRASFGVDWVSLFRSSCVSLLMDAPDVRVFRTMLSSIRYPRNERSCEWKLHDILKPKRFLSKKNKTDWGHLGNPEKQELYFVLDDSVVNSLPFMVEYPSKTKIHLTFRNKKDTKQVSGDAAVQVQGRLRLRKTLMEKFAVAFGTKKKHRFFTFYEEKPSDGIHPAEWVAYEL